MSIRVLMKNFFRVGFSTSDFYSVINGMYKQFYSEYYMLHYPISRNRGEDLLQCQKNLTDFCISNLPDLEGKEILDIGCGNGVLGIAQELRGQNALRRVDFLVDNAQKLHHIKDDSIDVVINIESAFHYPDKASFVTQVHRVLRPNGYFLIADILNRSKTGTKAFRSWQKRMNLHHWTLVDYHNAFKEAGLKIIYQDDISREILHGFHRCRIWSETFRKQNLLIAVFGYLWGKTMAGINSFLLLTLRRYHIFVVKKTIYS